MRALLVIDMVSDFVEETGALYCGEAVREILPAVKAKVEEFRSKGQPVIYLIDTHLADDKEFEMFPPHCVAGTPGGKPVPGLVPAPGDIVIPKRRYSAFYGTDLDLHLRDLGVDEIVLVGVCTNICVFFTAADARMRGYRVTVVRDGVASFDVEAHAFALGQMEKVLGAKIV